MEEGLRLWKGREKKLNNGEGNLKQERVTVKKEEIERARGRAWAGQRDQKRGAGKQSERERLRKSSAKEKKERGLSMICLGVVFQKPASLS